MSAKCPTNSGFRNGLLKRAYRPRCEGQVCTCAAQGKWYAARCSGKSSTACPRPPPPTAQPSASPTLAPTHQVLSTPSPVVQVGLNLGIVRTNHNHNHVRGLTQPNTPITSCFPLTRSACVLPARGALRVALGLGPRWS